MELHKDQPQILPLALRRDRGYVYFPDAIKASLRQFAQGKWTNLNAECYRTSAKIIRVEEQAEGPRDGLFGRIVFTEGLRRRTINLIEDPQDNPDRYDLIEPPYASRFHRWAAQCKKLYHQVDREAGWRMFLQRIEIFASEELNGEESFELDFKTKEKFLKFSVWKNESRVGTIVAAARKVD